MHCPQALDRAVDARRGCSALHPDARRTSSFTSSSDARCSSIAAHGAGQHAFPGFGRPAWLPQVWDVRAYASTPPGASSRSPCSHAGERDRCVRGHRALAPPLARRERLRAMGAVSAATLVCAATRFEMPVRRRCAIALLEGYLIALQRYAAASGPARSQVQRTGRAARAGMGAAAWQLVLSSRCFSRSWQRRRPGSAGRADPYQLPLSAQSGDRDPLRIDLVILALTTLTLASTPLGSTCSPTSAVTAMEKRSST